LFIGPGALLFVNYNEIYYNLSNFDYQGGQEPSIRSLL